MSEFDINLIREFESRPGFYDRNSHHFKDKIYNAQAWQDISNMLGYDVALLKDRMLQLRNRYNLEKRRLENLCEEYPTKLIQSQWPLYEHLHFLSDHIRPRRSYKRMLTRPSIEYQNSKSNHSSCSEQNNSTINHTNGSITVKMENGFEDEESEEVSNADDVDMDFDASNSMFPDNNDVTPAAAATTTTTASTANTSTPISSSTAIPTSTPIATTGSSASLLRPISVKNIDSMRTIVPKENIKRVPPPDSPVIMPEKRIRMEPTARLQKFDAFGKFVSSSLIELPAEKALKLVEKFTSDIVKVLIEKNHSKNGDKKEKSKVSDDDCL